jgi:hypothetical protein
MTPREGMDPRYQPAGMTKGEMDSAVDQVTCHAIVECSAFYKYAVLMHTLRRVGV